MSQFKAIRPFIFVLLMGFLVSCGGDAKEGENGEETNQELADLPNVEGTKVKIETSMGDVYVVLYDQTPKHRDNFIKLVKEDFYNGIIFHRVIKDFMIQGGDPNSIDAPVGAQLGNGGPGYTIPAEIIPGLYHKKGALCAARQGDQVNPEKASSGSQFYIVTGKISGEDELNYIESMCNQQIEYPLIDAFIQAPENVDYLNRLQEYQAMRQDQASAILSDSLIMSLVDEIRPLALNGVETFKYTDEQKKTYATIGGTAQLDNQYTVFGEVIKGLEVVDAIGVTPTAQGDRPIEDVVIKSMKIIE